ncbi:hypothetical protein MTR_4g006460 [Medicago truncatula]|uniref:Uncharacterized protein n=1 Tax=Medicago truncatula TaxID=3880 RepID=G7JD75_MEDTR|nr:hypothetical protein MTR_4g006460 [Medicago truncatula]
MVSSITTCKTAAADFYLPYDCWVCVFRFLINDNRDKDHNHRYLKSLSLVSKQFFSITNLLHLSLTICDQTHPFLPRLFQRFTNLNSLDLSCYSGYLNKLLCQISSFPLRLTSLVFSVQTTITTNGLQLLDLSHCKDVSEEGMVHVLMICCNIRHLNLTRCSRLKLLTLNFEVPKLESCSGLVQLSLKFCEGVTEKGVKHVVEKCTQLREIDLKYCDKSLPSNSTHQRVVCRLDPLTWLRFVALLSLVVNGSRRYVVAGI